MQEKDNIVTVTEEDLKDKSRVSLERALQAYRCMNMDKSLTWKQNYVNDKYSSDSLLDCTQEEIRRFGERLGFSITIAKSIKQHSGDILTGREILKYILSKKYAEVPKGDKPVIFSTSTGIRPQGQKGFEIWNGFQVIDMDIKDRDRATILKQYIFDDLKNYNWFVGVAYSSSGTGLHIYTKIQIPENDTDLQKKKILYFTNFRHKYSFIYIACRKVLDKLGATEDELLKWMDLAMFRPQQGAFIPHDDKPLFSTQFFEDFIYVCFDHVEDMGDPDVDWVSYPPLKQAFKRWEWFEANDNDNTDNNLNIESAPELNLSKMAR